MKKLATLIIILSLALVSAGCSSTNTIERYLIANTQYSSISEFENAVQQSEFDADKALYANILFNESPLGMTYTCNWYIDGKEIKSESKEMTADKRGIICFMLEADKVKSGSARFEIIYGDDILLKKEFVIQ